MPEEKTELRVKNPGGETKKKPVMSASPRLNDLKGKKMGNIRGRIQAGEVLFPYLEKALKERSPSTRWDIPEMLFIEDAEERAARLKEMIDPYDGIVISLAISGGSTTRITPQALEIEKLGKPVVFIVTSCFQTTARYFAQNQGLEDIAIAPFAMDYVPPAEEIEKLDLAEDVAEKVIHALTEWSPGSPVIEELSDNVLTYSGASHLEAYENMEKSFLQHGWSDGLPLVPPTQQAVNRMLEGAELPADHLIAVFRSGQGKATVEKISVNAVMAACSENRHRSFSGSRRTP